MIGHRSLTRKTLGAETTTLPLLVYFRPARIGEFLTDLYVVVMSSGSVPVPGDLSRGRYSKPNGELSTSSLTAVVLTRTLTVLDIDR